MGQYFVLRKAVNPVIYKKQVQNGHYVCARNAVGTANVQSGSKSSSIGVIVGVVVGVGAALLIILLLLILFLRRRRIARKHEELHHLSVMRKAQEARFVVLVESARFGEW